MRAFTAFMIVVVLAITGTVIVWWQVGDPAFRWALATAIWTTWTTFAALSIYRQRPGERRAVMFMGTFDGVLMNGTDYDDLHRKYAEAGRLGDFDSYATKGFLDFAYRQFPFYFDVRNVTTAVIRIPVKSTEGAFTRRFDVYNVLKHVVRTRKDKDGKFLGKVEEPTVVIETQENPRRPPVSPGSRKETRILPDAEKRLPEEKFEESAETHTVEPKAYPAVEMSIDVEVLIELGVNLGQLISKIPKAKLDDPKDIGEALKNAGAEQVVQEAIIRAAKRRVWGTGDDDDIQTEIGRDRLEDDIILILREGKSIFVRAGLLREAPPRVAAQPPAPVVPAVQDVLHGETVASIDIAMERPVPRSDDFRKKIGLVAEAGYEAEAERVRQMGTTQALDDRGKVFQENPEAKEAAALDAIKEQKGIVALGAKDLFTGLRNITKK